MMGLWEVGSETTSLNEVLKLGIPTVYEVKCHT